MLPEFIAQEYVGTPDVEYTVGVLLDLDGNLINSIAIKQYILSALSDRIKVPDRSARKDLGPVLAISSGVSQGEIRHFAEVTRGCGRLRWRSAPRARRRTVPARGRRGVRVRDQPAVLGHNIAAAMVGYNEPDVLVRRHLLGADIPAHFEYGSGVILRSLSETLVESGVAGRV